PKLVGMALMAALSPTLVFASRTADPIIAVAFCSLLLVIAVLRAGIARPEAVIGWAALAGIATGGALGSGPESVTSLLAIAIGLGAAAAVEAPNEAATVGPALRRLGHTPGAIAAYGAGLVITVVVLFTRLFSQLDAIEGIWLTSTNWSRLMASTTTTTPVQFFLFAVLLYEMLALVFAGVALLSGERPQDGGRRPSIPASLFATWFVVTLVLQSFASGRTPDQALIVTLPLVLLGGQGLGLVFERLPWTQVWRSPLGFIPLAIAGIAIGLTAIGVLLARSNDGIRQPSQPASTGELIIQLAFVLLLVVLPLGYLIVELAARLDQGRRARILGSMALLVVAVLLGAYTVRATTSLAFFSADDGNELLAQRIPTEGVRAFVNQTLRLSRDVSLAETSPEDNTGSFGVSIALAPETQWPYLWYFRDFPDLSVTGQAGWGEADIVVAPSEAGMAEAGYVVDRFTWVNRVPPAYQAPDPGSLLERIISPSQWYSGIRYLLFRELAEDVEPETIAVGREVQLANQINPNAGPFNLFEQVGTGAGLGQFNGPTGLAASLDGETIYVIDAGNQRIERFEVDGDFIGIWGGRDDPNLTLGYNFNQGASGITVDQKGLIYVADTWNHRVFVLDEFGQIIRELGQPGVPTDLENSPDPSLQPGLFFGPRGVAVDGEEIFVTDTGNERVQVFASDGTFLRAFGGYGSGPGQLIEPTGIVIGQDGRVYVADSGNGRLSIFAKDGTPLAQVPIESWMNQARQLNYLTFAPSGVLLMSAPAAGVVDVFDPATGMVVSTIEGADGVALSAPTGIEVLPDGALIVADDGQSAVFELTSDVSGILPSLPSASPSASPVGATPEATPALRG
ncbi:MAG: NHL repeat-containing protein, partial [Chloroflexota bacterium]|nr:NHL repeat-containing protein [Chloroflexota bacterium]